MFKNKKMISLFLSLILLFSVVAPAYAQSEECDCESTVVYTNAENGMSVVEVKNNNDGNTHYATVSSTISINSEDNLALLANNNESVVVERTYFQFEKNLEEAIKSANSAPVLGEIGIQSGFWKGSKIEKIWSAVKGFGYKVYIAAGDASYIIGLGVAAVGALFGILAAKAIITAGFAAAVTAIVTGLILTAYQVVRDEDMSVTFEMYERDLVRSIVCLTVGDEVGKTTVKNILMHFFWPRDLPTKCF